MSSRDEILNKLRDNLSRYDLRFPPENPLPLPPDARMEVTHAEGDRWALARRFGAELRKLHGSYDLLETAAEARLATIAQLMTWMEEDRAQRRTKEREQESDWDVLMWDPEVLPIPGLAPSLTDIGFHMIIPDDLHDKAVRERIHPIRAGLTGVDAAFASTGSMLLTSGPGKSRAASLTPLRHLALIPLSKLYSTIEEWMAKARKQGELTRLLRDNANAVLITGPSKSADIEMNLTLGVHGPQVVHAILFDDLESLIQNRS
jgi:L-lactate dehydrogenase complex protein LldG